jgi:monoamine oxidase
MVGLFAGCGLNDSSEGDFDGTVLIVGAGPAGMTAAHLLAQKGVGFQLLEAASTQGGRVRHDLAFTDFPIPLGAEWLHVAPDVLDEIVNDPAVAVTTELAPYPADAQQGYFDGTFTLEPLDGWESDRKFIGSSWLDFFNTYLMPGIADRISYNTVVTAIDHSGDRVVVTDAGGATREADRVIVTVPLKILQRGDITFLPPLAAERTRVIAEANVWSGLKAFIEFDELFYPPVIVTADSETDDGQRLYYDAAYGQRSDANVLGLFSVGAQAESYQAALGEGRLLDRMLGELDAIFDGAASASYRRHIVQDWNAEPFAGAAYLADVASPDTSTALAEPIDGRIFFAGEAYTDFDDWGGVHAATRSAADAVRQLLNS